MRKTFLPLLGAICTLAFFVSCANNLLDRFLERTSDEATISISVGSSAREASEESSQDDFVYLLSVSEYIDWETYEKTHSYENGQEENYYYEEERYYKTFEGTSSGGKIIAEGLPVGKQIELYLYLVFEDGSYYRANTEYGEPITVVNGENNVSLKIQESVYYGSANVKFTLLSDAESSNYYTYQYALDSVANFTSADVSSDNVFSIYTNEYGKHTLIMQALDADGSVKYMGAADFTTTIDGSTLDLEISLKEPSKVSLVLTDLPVPDSSNYDTSTSATWKIQDTTAEVGTTVSYNYVWYCTATVSYGSVKNIYTLSSGSAYATLITSGSTSKETVLELPAGVKGNVEIKLYSLDRTQFNTFDNPTNADALKELALELSDSDTYPAYTGGGTFTTESGSQDVEIKMQKVE